MICVNEIISVVCSIIRYKIQVFLRLDMAAKYDTLDQEKLANEVCISVKLQSRAELLRHVSSSYGKSQWAA